MVFTLVCVGSVQVLLTVYIYLRRSRGDYRIRRRVVRARDRWHQIPVYRYRHRPLPYSHQAVWRTPGKAWPPASEIRPSRLAPSLKCLGKSKPARTLHVGHHLPYKNPTTTSPFKNSSNSVIGSTNVSEKSIECYRPVFLLKPCSGAHCRCLRRRRFFLWRLASSFLHWRCLLKIYETKKSTSTLFQRALQISVLLQHRQLPTDGSKLLANLRTAKFRKKVQRNNNPYSLLAFLHC